jgi:hypothetical protein
MDTWVMDYVRSCHVCQQNKSPRHRQFGLLQPLDLPFAPWDSIGMDFITTLPSSKGYTSIWVIIDRFTKMAHFIPIKKGMKNKELFMLFLKEVWRLHGLPSSIISDRDSRFTAKEWDSLMEHLDVKLKMSTAFHPETDGQTERLNQVIEAYLRAFVNYEQDNWSELLPLAEYAYNNASHSGTGYSPFYANYGYHVRTNWPTNKEVKNPTSRLYAHWLNQIHEELLVRIRKSQETMVKYANKKRSDKYELNVGDLVMLNGKNLKTRRPKKKLDHKFWGPFKILRNIKGTAFQLELPDEWNIHDVFHASLLEPYRKSTIDGRSNDVPQETEEHIELELKADAEDYTEEFEMEEILDARKIHGKVLYLVKWKGYPEEKDWTEEPAEHFQKEALWEFHKKFPRKPRGVKVPS